MTNRKARPLAAIVSLHCTWIVAVFMAIYGTVEVWLFGDSALVTALRHTSHVVLIFGGLGAILHFVLRRYVTKPIAQINAQLYRLGAGATDVRPIDTDVSELRQIVHGIERMRKRMYVGETGAALREAELALMEIRDQAKALYPDHPRASQAILDSVVRVGETLGGLL
ncbi:MAG: hypothetical protein Kow0092_06690 [Deferrisomatales bacterium]